MDELLTGNFAAGPNPSDIPTGRFTWQGDTMHSVVADGNVVKFKQLAGTITATTDGRRIVFESPKPQVEAKILFGRVNVDINDVVITPTEMRVATRWKTAVVRWQ